MSSFRIRPRFIHMSEVSPDKILYQFSARLKEKEDGFTGVVIPDHIIIKVYQNDRHIFRS